MQEGQEEIKELTENLKCLSYNLSQFYASAFSTPTDILSLKEQVASAMYERAKVYFKLGWAIQAIYYCRCALEFISSEELYIDITKLSIEAELSVQRYERVKHLIETLQQLGVHSEDYRLESISSSSNSANILAANGKQVSMIGGSTRTQTYPRI